MNVLIRLRIGPRPSSVTTAQPTARQTFDVQLSFDDAELEEMGVAMAYYTLGAMADQPEIDLPGAEWGWNLERALQSPNITISPRQVGRREKILRHIR